MSVPTVYPIQERPIIFSGESVRAILAGRKTQTRRAIKDQPIDVLTNGTPWLRMDLASKALGRLPFWTSLKCPYGKVGERLWVREVWSPYRGFAKDLLPDAPILRKADMDECGQVPCILNGESVRVNNREPWCSPLFMPRRASRLTLDIVNISVERIQEISIDDVIAEGIESVTDGSHANEYWREETGAKFVSAWDKLNAKRGYSWESNPWVWVLEFRRVLDGEMKR